MCSQSTVGMSECLSFAALQRVVACCSGRLEVDPSRNPRPGRSANCVWMQVVRAFWLTRCGRWPPSSQSEGPEPCVQASRAVWTFSIGQCSRTCMGKSRICHMRQIGYDCAKHTWPGLQLPLLKILVEP